MIPDGHEFTLLLTHDVDRPHESFQSLYYAIADRDPSQLRTALSTEDPYWQFGDILSLEDELGVRSSFYFLREKGMLERSLEDWTSPRYWIEALGRYDPESPEIVDLMRTLERGGWEVGLHGSFDSYQEPDRLEYEKDSLEAILGHEVLGGRQHYLNLEKPDTWHYQADAGLKYDTSLGSSSTYGFDDGYDPIRPFDDEFVVFPTTLMEVALPNVPQVEEAWRECERLLEEAATNNAVMNVLWHPRYFNEDAFPGYRELYRRLIERAQELDAWIGPAGEFYAQMDHPENGSGDVRLLS